MELQGSFEVNAPNCGVVINSSDPDALQFTGAKGSLSAGSVGVAGGCGGHCEDSTPAPVTGMVPVSDPFSGKPQGTPPDPTKISPACAAAPGNKLTGTLADPAGGIVCYSGNVTLTNVTLGTGTYVFTGNVTLDGNVSTKVQLSNPPGSTLPAQPNAGATIDIDTGTLSINTGTVLALYGPNAGNQSGIALMEPSYNSNTITIQKGNASGLIDGIIYAPSAQLFLQDSGGDPTGLTLITDLIVGSLYDKTAELNIQSFSQSTNLSPLTKVALVE
jgi:hypothetical protein